MSLELQVVNGIRYDVDGFMKAHTLRWLEAQVVYISAKHASAIVF